MPAPKSCLAQLERALGQCAMRRQRTVSIAHKRHLVFRVQTPSAVAEWHRRAVRGTSTGRVANFRIMTSWLPNTNQNYWTAGVHAHTISFPNGTLLHKFKSATHVFFMASDDTPRQKCGPIPVNFKILASCSLMLVASLGFYLLAWFTIDVNLAGSVCMFVSAFCCFLATCMYVCRCKVQRVGAAEISVLDCDSIGSESMMDVV